MFRVSGDGTQAPTGRQRTRRSVPAWRAGVAAAAVATALGGTAVEAQVAPPPDAFSSLHVQRLVERGRAVRDLGAEGIDAYEARLGHVKDDAITDNGQRLIQVRVDWNVF